MAEFMGMEFDEHVSGSRETGLQVELFHGHIYDKEMFLNWLEQEIQRGTISNKDITERIK